MPNSHDPQPSPYIAALFVDIGGVLLTNGWDRGMRRRAAETFGLDYEDMDERHHLTFDTYEEGKLSLDEYLRRVVFYTERPFSVQDFRSHMFAQSKPYPDTIALIRDLKKRYNLKIAAVSNEGRELTVHRIEAFELGTFIDFFISSCFVHLRKPDEDIYRIALDVAQVTAEEVVYIEDRPMFVDVAQVTAEEVVYVEDRPMFVDVARGLGIQGVRHLGYAPTRDVLARWGLLSDV